MGLFLSIFLIVLCLLVEIYFSGSEIALVVSDKMRLKARADAAKGGAMSAMWFVRHPAHFFATVILGTNISVIAASTVATFYLISNYGEKAEVWAMLLSPIILIFGEVLPKSIFQHNANRLVEKIAPPLIICMYSLYPAVWLLSKLTHILLGGVQSHLGGEPRITREELALMIRSTDTSDVKPTERKMVSKILELANLTAENVMVPLAHVESLPSTSTRDVALNVFDLKGFSKLPVFEHRAYNVVGLVDCLDVLFSKEPTIENIYRPVMYVPKNMRLHDLYRAMREREEQIVIVVDEWGAAVGLVTLEDVLEEIVGDIKDEYEFSRQHWHVAGKNRYIIFAQIEIEEANERLSLDIPKGDWETLAGFLLHKFGRIPSVGELVVCGKWSYTVRRVTDRAIVEVDVKRADRLEESSKK